MEDNIMAWSWWEGFDRMMCGKWISEQFEINGNYVRIFLHIEQKENEEVTVKFDIDSDAFNNTAVYVEYSDNSLYFFHNDREHRAKYIMTMENDNFIKCEFSVKNCWGYKGKFEKNLNFTRLEALTEEEYKKYAMSNKVRAKTAARIEILKEYADYGDIKSDVKFGFEFDERENMLDIIEKYNLDELTKGKNDVETAITLMHWFCGHYRHGDIGLARTSTPQAIMKFADEHGGKTNCRGLAIALAQLIRAYNIKAFHITCLPYEEPCGDCHVIVCVYCKSLNKYIMLDPSANLYLKNKNGEMIGVEELRDILIGGEELIQNENSTNWGNDEKMDNLNEYRDYMAKNLIRIERYNISGYGIDFINKDGRTILIPKKYMENEAKNFDESIQKDFVTSREYFWQI